jgi:glycosyltransferase involved in cell wall biosynthesis
VKKEKLLFLSSIATPQQIKFCEALQTHFDAEFWFYESAVRTRGNWWHVDLGAHCRILPNVLFPTSGPFEGRYWAPNITRQLEQFDPDIVMLGGFSIPSNLIAYRWAKHHKKKTIVFTERSRNSKGVLRKRSFGWCVLSWLYRGLDMVIVSADDAVPQFRDELGFGNKVVAGRYASDLDDYFSHLLREAKPAYTYLFANRMTEIYNPIGVIDIFSQVLSKHPGSRLVMNAAGELSEVCRARIAEVGIGGAVEFLSDLKSWGDLNHVYARCDILLLPANFSNGNFTILEAMASGMGLVVSDRVLGIGKMVVDGENGFSCEPTTEAFMDRIERYILHPELLKMHAAMNRPLVAPLSAQGTAKFFSKILHERD